MNIGYNRALCHHSIVWLLFKSRQTNKQNLARLRLPTISCVAGDAGVMEMLPAAETELL